jgi:multiple sugar transport system substrate-binding protein
LKALFTLTLLFLVLISAATYLNLPGALSDKPQVNWIIAGGPEKIEQVEMFYAWMKENNYPQFDLKMEKPSGRPEKKNIIQGISGVAADILDCYEEHIPLYQSVGMLADLTDIVEEMGLGLEQTYPSVRSSMQVDGRQYGFPRNVSSKLLLVNVEAFERLGLSPPPSVWSFEEFEQHGKAYIAAANVPGEHQTTYFSTPMGLYERIVYYRSMGKDYYNETLTRVDIEDPVYEEIYTMLHRWTHDLNLLPTALEAKGLSSASSGGLGTAGFHLFSEGRYGMMTGSRWGLLVIRKIGPKKLSISEFPNGGFRNAVAYYGAAAIYAGSKHKDLAAYLLKFMASEEFNMHIVRSGDGLPPVAKYIETEEFLRPKDFPNEWNVHSRIREIITEITMPLPSSPFVAMLSVTRIEKNAFDKFSSDLSDAKESIRFAAEMINAEMKRAAGESPKLAVKYEEGLKNQAEIERLRSEEQLVPLHLITNPFYRRYYVEQGWSLPEGDEEELTVASSQQ